MRARRFDASAPTAKSLYAWRCGIALLAVCCLLVSACQRQADRSASRSAAAQVRFALASAAVNLDPRYATDAASSRINRLLYRRLIKFDDHYRVLPDCAHWQKVAARVYQFQLNDDCPPFSNGHAVRSDDVIATYQSVLDATLASPFRQRLQGIESIQRVDDETLQFHLYKDDPLFPAYLDIGILPKELIVRAHQFSHAPLGNGAFKLLRFDSPDQLILQRVADGMRIEFFHVPDPTVRMLMLMRHEVDICQNDLTPELVNYARQDASIKVVQGKGSNFSYLGFNLEDPVLSDVRVRRAIAMSINRKAIIESVFYSAARPASSLLPPDHWLFEQSFVGEAYDPAAARALLRDAGFADRPLHLSYKTSKDPFRVRLATIIQSQLRQVGIAMEIRSLDWGSFFADVKAGNFQLYSLSWVGIRTPDIYRHVFYSESIPPKGANRGRFHNSDVDRWLDLAQDSNDLQRIRHDITEVQQIVLQQLPYVPLWYEDHIALLADKLEGYQINRSGNYDSLKQVYWRQ